MVDLYEQAGPTTLCDMVLPGGYLFGYDGFMSLMVGQRAPTRFKNELTSEDLARWDAYRAELRRRIGPAVPMNEALRRLCA